MPKLFVCRKGIHQAVSCTHDCEYGYECKTCDECLFRFEITQVSGKELKEILNAEANQLSPPSKR